MYKGRRIWMSQLKHRANSPFLCFSVLFRPSRDWMRSTQAGEDNLPYWAYREMLPEHLQRPTQKKMYHIFTKNSEGSYSVHTSGWLIFHFSFALFGIMYVRLEHGKKSHFIIILYFSILYLFSIYAQSVSK